MKTETIIYKTLEDLYNRVEALSETANQAFNAYDDEAAAEYLKQIEKAQHKIDILEYIIEQSTVTRET